jgi:hypothetical protein
MDRRAFLRTLLGGTAAIAVAPLVPKGTVFSFLGGIFKPKRELWVPGAYYPTLADIVRRLPPDAQFAKIADLLNQPCAVFDDLPWMGEIENGAVTYDSSLST